MKGEDFMSTTTNPQPGWLKKVGIFVLFFIIESLVFCLITLSPYLPQTILLNFHIGLTAVLLLVALYLKRSEKGKLFWPVFYAFFVAGAAVLISFLFSDDLMRFFRQAPVTPQGIATAKFSQSILQVIPILLLMPVMGFNWRSMYLKAGKVRFWLPVAIAAMIVFPALAFFPLNSGMPGVLDKLLPLWPWILIFVLSNGFTEELLYRGLFLKHFENFLGKGLSIVLTAIVFAIMHTQVTYAAEMIQFLVIVLVLSLIWGFLIQKTDSLWGAVLFHAAGDCLIIFGAFASM